EASHPAPGMIKIGKPACRVIRPILASTKQRLGVSIVVGDTCATVRCNDPQLLKLGMNQRAFHGRAVIPMQNQWAMVALLAQHGTVNDCGAVGHGRGIKDFVANDLATVDVNEQIQIKELATDLGGQVGDIPAPANVGLVSKMSTRWPLPTRRCLAAPTVLFIGSMQDAIKTRFRSQVALLIVKQASHDLCGRQAGKGRPMADIEHGLTLRFAQGMGGSRSYGMRALILSAPGPASISVLSDPQFLAYAMQPCTIAPGLVDQCKDLTAICGIGHFSSSPQIAWTFFRKVRSAAVSARAASLRRNSRSSSRSRLRSAFDASAWRAASSSLRSLACSQLARQRLICSGYSPRRRQYLASSSSV